jgi:hypothetical protein
MEKLGWSNPNGEPLASAARVQVFGVSPVVVMSSRSSRLVAQVKSGDQTGPAWMLQSGLASVTSRG